MNILLRRYRETDKNIAPTLSLATLVSWSTKYGWVARSEEYDVHLEEEKNRRAEEIMSSGLALIHERTQELKELYDLLKGELMEMGENGAKHNLWLPDVKQIGQGEFTERVDIERYNSALVNDIRGLLDDLAKETGGRTSKQSNLNIDLDLDDLTDQQLERVKRGEDLYSILTTPSKS